MMNNQHKDDRQYKYWQDQQQERWEQTCRSCGACCGATEDPCAHLMAKGDKTYFCDIYNNRFGTHQTISGKMLNCVPVREILNKSWPGDQHCAYKKIHKENS